MMTAAEKRELYMKAYNDNKEIIDNRIEEGIETNRKGYCRIRFTDEKGNPIKGAKVKVNQTGHEFKYGANIFMLDEFEKEEDNAEYRRMFKEYFNLATVPFYWKDLEPEDGKPRYDKNSYKIYRRPAPDLCMDYCEQNGIMPKLHCLVYNSWTPEWAAALPSAELKKRYEKRFQEIAERYSGRMFEFEVINETLIQGISVPLCDERGIVEWAFDLARKYFPNEKLVINEADPFPCIGRNTPSSVSPYVDRYFLQLENLLLKGVSIDRIGVQNHMFVGVSAHTPEEYEKSVRDHAFAADPINIYRGLDAIGSFGLPVENTEMTIPTFGDTEEDEELQADLLKLMYSVWFSHPSIYAVVYWNTVDGYAHTGNPNWIENNCRGGLFHHDLTPKKSALMLKKLFSEVWHTDGEFVTDNDGCIEFRGFYGDYLATVETDGKTSENKFSVLSKQKNTKDFII